MQLVAMKTSLIKKWIRAVINVEQINRVVLTRGANKKGHEVVTFLYLK
jgi:hypothetical protein